MNLQLYIFSTCKYTFTLFNSLSKFEVLDKTSSPSSMSSATDSNLLRSLVFVNASELPLLTDSSSLYLFLRRLGLQFGLVFGLNVLCFSLPKFVK